MPAPRRVALIVLLLALLVGLVWHETFDNRRSRAQSAQTPRFGDVAATTDDITRPAPESPELVGATAAPAESALPPDLARLVARADAGDARAACELGARLVVCANSSWLRDDILEVIRQRELAAENQNHHGSANQAAEILLRANLARQACSKVTPSLRLRAFEFTRQAAIAGEPEAIVRYATGQALAGDSMAQQAILRSPHFETWRSEAPALLEALEQSGDPQAVLALLVAGKEGNQFALLLPSDPTRDAAYHLLAQRLFGNHAYLAQLHMPLITAAQLREADALARAWHRDLFGDRTFRLEDHTSGLYQPLSLDVEANWPKPSDAASACFDMENGEDP